MEKIDYLAIIKKSWTLTWKNKIFWIFGFFILLESLITGLLMNREELFSILSKVNLDIPLFKKEYSPTVVIIFFLIISLLLSVLKILGKAAITLSATSKNAINKKLKFFSLLKESQLRFKRLFLLEILFLIVMLLFLFIIFLPFIFLLKAKLIVPIFFLGFFALLLIFLVSVIVYFVKKFSFIYITLSEITLRDSLEKSYALLRNFLNKNIFFSLLILIIELSLNLILIIIFLPILILLSLFVFWISSYFLSKIVFIILTFCLSIILLLLFITIRSAFEVFHQTSWVFFFEELTSIKTKDDKLPLEEVSGETIGLENV